MRLIARKDKLKTIYNYLLNYGSVEKSFLVSILSKDEFKRFLRFLKRNKMLLGVKESPTFYPDLVFYIDFPKFEDYLIKHKIIEVDEYERYFREKKVEN